MADRVTATSPVVVGYDFMITANDGFRGRIDVAPHKTACSHFRSLASCSRTSASVGHQLGKLCAYLQPPAVLR